MKKAFSLIELLIGLIIISIIIAAFAPIMTKKSNNQKTALNQKNVVTKKCSEISPNCKVCSEGKCLVCALSSCSSGQFLNKSLCKCTNCSTIAQGCTTCIDGLCTNCNTEGRYLYNNTCPFCSTKDANCLECISKPISFTTNPTGAIKCLRCKEGYYLDLNGVCKSCSAKFGAYCKNCTENECLGCSSGYEIRHTPEANSKTSCCAPTVARNCVLCNTDGNRCESCYAGGQPVVKMSDYSCKLCSEISPGCIDCTPTGCKRCLSGYVLNGGLCQSISGSSCIASDGIKCTGCQNVSGIVLKNGSCQNCSTLYGQKCTNCNVTECTQCESGYIFVKSENTCRTCNIWGCGTCHYSGANVACDNCIPGYVHYGSSCIKCEANCKYCSQRDGSGCTECWGEYSLSTSNHCVLCNIENCEKCSANNTCSTCKKGQYLTRTNTCASCGLGCRECTTPNNCTSCAPNYYLNSGGTCTSCSNYHKDCNRCTSDSCTQCTNGKVWTHGTCLTPPSS